MSRVVGEKRLWQSEWNSTACVAGPQQSCQCRCHEPVWRQPRFSIGLAQCGIVSRYRPSGHQTQRWQPSRGATMRESIQIRPAQPVDAEGAAVLLSSAYTHTHVSSPLREAHASGLIERLEHFFRRDGNRFSYQYIQLAEQSSEVVGLVLSGWRVERRQGPTPPLEAGSNGRLRTMNGMSMPSLCSAIGAARGSARACCKVRSGRRASTTLPKSLCMSLKGTKRHWICMRICTMGSPSRPSSINVAMSAWSKHGKTGNRETTERRGRRGVLNECGGSVATNEEEEQELHVPPVNQSRDKERH